MALKKIIFLVALAFVSLATYSQTSLSFCTFVNTTGQECVFENTKFITSPDSIRGRLFMLVRSTEAYGTTKLIYKVYGIDRFDKEVFLFSITQDVQADWLNSWQPAYFTSPGKYIVKVYKDDDHMITSRGFEFFNL
jgi:hypothetical protein